MDAEYLLAHREQVIAALAALAVFGAAVALAWPLLVPPELTRRLREQADGGARERIKRREARAGQAQQPTGLRDQQSRSLARLVATFRVAERLNNSRTVQMLQQAGYRGRGAALQYMAAQLICPLIFTGVAGLFVILVLPTYEPLYIRGGALVGGGVFGFYLPSLLLKNRIEKRKIEIGRAWPDAVDLLLICVETGMSIEHAFRKVAEEMAGTSLELAKEMSLTNAELNYLKERRQAYENLSRRVNLESVQAVTSTLIQSERYGTSLGASLRVLSQESRAMRMAAAEKKAAALPPKLTVPMIIFFLPVLFAVIITPAALQISAG